MAKKPTLSTIASGYASNTTLNSNFEELRDAFDNTLSLDGSTPNAMGADLDLNGNNIIGATGLTVNGTDYLAEVTAAKAAALVAQAAAETAETNAETAETNAGSSETAAASSASAASSSATASAASAVDSTNNGAAQVALAANQVALAGTARTGAETAETNAETAAALATTNGAAQVVLATDQVALATTQAGLATTNGAAQVTLATTQANNAAGSATTATAQAVIATTKAGEASASATQAAADVASIAGAAGAAVDAANSAAAAAAALDNFDDRYLGPKSSEPTVDNDGDALISGSLYFSTTSNAMQVYDGANWIAASASGVASMILYEYTATAGQTTFTGADDNNNSISFIQGNQIVVFNGIILDPSDYNSTTGTSIVLNVGAALNDLINVYAFKSFTVADTVSASTGGTFGGNIDVTGTVTADGLTVDGNATFTSTDTSDQFIIQNNDSGVGSAPDVVLYRNSATPADGDVIGRIDYRGKDDGAVDRDYITLYSKIADASTGSAGGSFHIQTRTGATTADRFVIGGDGNVGVGTSSPSELLEIEDGNMLFTNTVSNDSRIYFTHSTSANRRSYIGALETDGNGNSLIFAPNANGFDAVEAMRIDTSGNVLVGKTNAATSTVGVELRANGKIVGTMDGGNHTLNRTTSDGSILQFSKDNASVGSIGATSGDLMIGTTDTGFRFLDGAEQIIPWNVTGNTNKDGVLDLGNSTNRFDNLYLSGGVVFGDAGGSGTSSSNTLDSYEEGTFTPVLSDASAGGNLATVANVRANYTKTGNQVNVCLNLNNITTTGMTAGNGFYIQGLPFTAPSYTTPNLNYVGSVRLQNILYSGYAVSEVQDNTSNIMVKEVLSGVGSNRLLVSDIASGTADISISLTYETT